MDRFMAKIVKKSDITTILHLKTEKITKIESEFLLLVGAYIGRERKKEGVGKMPTPSSGL